MLQGVARFMSVGSHDPHQAQESSMARIRPRGALRVHKLPGGMVHARWLLEDITRIRRIKPNLGHNVWKKHCSRISFNAGALQHNLCHRSSLCCKARFMCDGLWKP